ncbi:MAG: GNAT family N-acetyltransferase [Clostridia bacterium]|nr:GNAT family N-acetyltransferase [Clostridia bacterium]
MLVLRDMIENDIEDYVIWFTRETEWGKWDSPWETFETNEDEERQLWREYYDSVKNLPADVTRWKYEIELDGKHIGWICSYTDLDYVENKENILAIGLDIPCEKDRKNGCGTKAFAMYMEYLKKHGHHSFYTQTWSGNLAMIRVAEKLGFKEIYRKANYRKVDGKLYDAITWRLDM